MLGRFLVFAFDTFYPEGGANDLVADFDDEAGFETAKKRTADVWDNYQIYDSEEFEIYDFKNYEEFEEVTYLQLVPGEERKR